MKLYYSGNLNPRLAVAVARHLQSPVEYVAATPRHPDCEAAFRPINPNTLVPVLVEGDRTYWETDAIACRLSELAGSDFWRRDGSQAEMIMWVSWATHHLNRAGDTWYFNNLVLPTFSSAKPDPREMDQAMGNWRKWMGILDDQLDGKTWLVGDRLSYADFRVGTVFPFAERAGLPMQGFARVRALADRLNAIDAWREPMAGLA